MKIAILDDYQNVARDFADWSRLPDGVEPTFSMTPSRTPTRWPPGWNRSK